MFDIFLIGCIIIIYAQRAVGKAKIAIFFRLKSSQHTRHENFLYHAYERIDKGDAYKLY
jgi:hypothetical protein